MKLEASDWGCNYEQDNNKQTNTHTHSHTHLHTRRDIYTHKYMDRNNTISFANNFPAGFASLNVFSCDNFALSSNCYVAK